jgi:hypothetical protein
MTADASSSYEQTERGYTSVHLPSHLHKFPDNLAAGISQLGQPDEGARSLRQGNRTRQ